MKIKIFLLLLLNIVICKAQIVDVSSPSLKYWIISSTTDNLRAKDLNGNWLKIDQNNDGELQLSEAQNVSYFLDMNGNTSSYDCIQSFTNLEEFHCQGNGWPIGINLSNLIHLKKLTLYSNNTTSLTLSGCVSLEEINVRSNALSALNLTDLNNLKKLDCAFNYLSALSLISTPNLIDLDCSNNNIYSLNLANLSALGSLICGSNNLTSLNLNNNAGLKKLYCSGLYLTSLNLTNQVLLEELGCGSNNLQSLDLSNCANLKSVNCSYAQLSSLNTNNLPLLENLICNNNSISILILVYNPNLKTLWCNANNLQEYLILSNQPVLETLLCQGNLLNSLDVSNCPNLINLDCGGNPILSLNLNNGFDWNPGFNFTGQNLPSITEVCTSANSLPAIQSYYNFVGLYPSIVSNCNLLATDDNGPMVQKMSLSPNPAKDEIVFSSNVNAVMIYDLNGRLIKIAVINGTRMNISDLEQGLYLLKIESDNEVFSSKLLVK
jgi:Leucine-rich repeat (LRR) protein